MLYLDLNQATGPTTQKNSHNTTGIRETDKTATGPREREKIFELYEEEESPDNFVTQISESQFDEA